MIRYYTVNIDYANGYDNDYSFHHYEQAKAKFDNVKNLTGVTYVSLTSTDDKEGDKVLERWEK